MKVNIVSSSRYKINRKQIKNEVTEWCRQYGLADQYTINIVFIGRTKMKKIASQYKKEDVALPVLAFPYLKEKINNEKLLGEIFICYPQTILLAAERNRKVDETILKLIEHGLENLT